MVKAHAVNTDMIIDLYRRSNLCIKEGVPLLAKYLVTIVLFHLGLLAIELGEAVGKLVELVVSWALDHFEVTRKLATAVALRLEHCIRHFMARAHDLQLKHVIQDSKDLQHLVYGRWNLCSKCKLAGHNKSNCPPDLKTKLGEEDALDDAVGMAKDISDLVLDG